MFCEQCPTVVPHQVQIGDMLSYLDDENNCWNYLIIEIENEVIKGYCVDDEHGENDGRLGTVMDRNPIYNIGSWHLHDKLKSYIADEPPW